MATDTYTYTGSVVVEACCACGIDFGMSRGLYDARRKDHGTFYCPNGHAQHYTAKSDEELLREEQKRNMQLRGLLTDERDQHHKTERRLQATRGVVTRTKRRIAQGLCPCCHEHFGNLERHIAKQHPDYSIQAVAEPAHIG
jgi:hypothetical protein